MAKIIDITDKVTLNPEKPKIYIGDTVIEVNSDAVSVLKMYGVIDNKNFKATDFTRICDLLFSEEDTEKLMKLNLSFDDYKTVIEAAVELVSGSVKDDGEKN